MNDIVCILHLQLNEGRERVEKETAETTEERK